MSDNGHEQPIQQPAKGTSPIGGDDPRAELLKQNRKLEELFLRRIDELRSHGAHDVRWLAEAKKDAERAFMALTRAIENPSRLQGELDDESH